MNFSPALQAANGGPDADSVRHAPTGIRSAVFETELLPGAVNLDQDLHFAALYLRASLTTQTEPLYPGYDFIVAVYERGIERYFVPAEDARRTAQWLIEKALAQPHWLADQLTAIERHSLDLACAFPSGITAEAMRASLTDDLLHIYRRHQELHERLYRFARLPEALDRGAPFFTDYLHDQLRGAGVGEADLSTVFEKLTCPASPSVFAQEQREFDDIVGEIAALCPRAATVQAPEMLLDARLRAALCRHREKWGFLSYHGYRNRTLPTEADAMRRLKTALRPGAAVGHRPQMIAEDVSPLTESVRNRLDGRHRELFRLYGEIGRVKLHRRFHQLRNFYYLDLLLAEAARRLDVDEWQVRCCLPEELAAALTSGSIDPAIAARRDRCVILYSGSATQIATGSDVDEILGRLRVRPSQPPDRMERRGTCACTGIARGRARVFVPGRPEQGGFQAGDVLVCEAADPDYLPLMRIASAVVTEQGGVTSHASVLCRELGVPTIIGVQDLFGFVKDGDVVEVNAFRGAVRRTEPEPGGMQDLLLLPPLLWDRPEIVGGKAAELERARKLGFNVPPFALLSWQGLCQAALTDAVQLAEFLRQLGDELRPKGESVSAVLLRSSATGENDPEDSRSGRYASVTCNVETLGPATVERFIAGNEAKGYRGSVILQWRVPATYCGVSIEGDQRIGVGDDLVLELVEGSTNIVTQGGGAIRLVLDRKSGELDYVRGKERASPPLLLDGSMLHWLAELSAAFGMPTYAEWGFYDGRLWLFQVRGSRHADEMTAVANLSSVDQSEAMAF